jgi:hypothetical protein
MRVVKISLHLDAASSADLPEVHVGVKENGVCGPAAFQELGREVSIAIKARAYTHQSR